MKVVLLSLIPALIVNYGCSSVAKKKDSSNSDQFNKVSEEEVKGKITEGQTIFDEFDAALNPSQAGLRLAEDQRAKEFTDCKVKVKPEEFGGQFRVDTCLTKIDGKEVECEVMKVAPSDENSADWEVFSDNCGSITIGEQPNPSENELPQPGETTTQTTESEKVEGMIVSSAEVTDCTAAFEQIESIYDDARSQYASFVSLAEDPKMLQDENIKLTKLPSNGIYATHYAFEPAGVQEGLIVSGEIGAGADETSVKLHQHIKQSIDLKSIFGNFGSAFEADTDLPIQHSDMAADLTIDLINKTAEMSLDYSLRLEGENPSSTQISSVVTINAGTNKSVNQKSSFTADDGKVTPTELNANILSADQIEVLGSVGDVKYNYLITRNGGDCKVDKK